jgi:uncharacterized metal-binding protein YceD (DUF177 family)
MIPWRGFGELAAWLERCRRYVGSMNDRLLIDMGTLPEEGKALSGMLPAEVFDLPLGDASALGPLEYELFAQRFGSELLLSGSLSARFEFTCVRTLHPFVQTIRVEDAAVSLEIGDAAVVDATEALREEVLVNFPVTPRCEDGDDAQRCEIDARYLSVDKPAGDELPTPPRAEGDDRWSALDELKNLKDQP